MPKWQTLYTISSLALLLLPITPWAESINSLTQQKGNPGKKKSIIFCQLCELNWLEGEGEPEHMLVGMGPLPVALNCSFGSAVTSNFILALCLHGRPQLMNVWRTTLSYRSVNLYRRVCFCIVVLVLVLICLNAFPELAWISVRAILDKRILRCKWQMKVCACWWAS